MSNAPIVETLEERTFMAANPWGAWPVFLGMDKVFAQYPWLDGGGRGVGIVDKGIDYFHPALGGNQATNTVAPRVVNAYDFRDNDTNPFPSESEATDPTTAHGTGVAGILTANEYNFNGRRYKGMLQDVKLLNLRTNRFDSQNTIKSALQWIINNRVQYNITAVNLTDFIGTGSPTPVYANEVAALKAAGVFILTPVANDWTNVQNPKQPIGYPAKDANVFGSGGILIDGKINPKTQRGQHLDLLGPSKNVSLPYYTPSTSSHIYVDYGEGNSWGTPHILGTAVWIQQIDPTVTPDEIMSILKDSGVTVADPDNTGTYKRLDMFAAVQLAYARRDDAHDGGDGNDTRGKAGSISLNNGSGSLSNLKLLIGDDDFYKITVTNVRDFDIFVDYNGSSDFPEAEVLDADGNLVGTIGEDGFSKRLTAGDYYIHLSADAESLIGAYAIQINPIAPVTSPGTDGTFNGIAYDAQNNLHFVWYDSNANVLKYSKRTNNVWSTTQIIDNTPNVGDFVSMKLDSTGKPGVAYYDPGQADLKYAHFNGTSWDVQTVDSTFTTGYYPSLQYNNADRPAISYYAKSGSALKFATGNDANPTNWNVAFVDTAGDVGRYSSLAKNTATGRWAVAYERTDTGVFKFAQMTANGGWSITNVDDTAKGGGYTSLAFDQNHRPAFSYYDAANADLKYARFDGNKWILARVASRKSQGLYTNLFFDPGNDFLPVIYYYNKSSDNTVVARSAGAAWDFEVVATGGGRYNNVTLDSDDFETFVWQDTASGDLKVAFL